MEKDTSLPSELLKVKVEAVAKKAIKKAEVKARIFPIFIKSPIKKIQKKKQK